MLGLEDFMTIHALVERGVYRCDMAEQLGVHPKTVSRTVKRGGPPAPRRGRRGSLLDPYRPVIDGLLAEGVWNAVVIWRELQARGYPGEISIIRDYLRPKRAHDVGHAQGSGNQRFGLRDRKRLPLKIPKDVRSACR